MARVHEVEKELEALRSLDAEPSQESVPETSSLRRRFLELERDSESRLATIRELENLLTVVQRDREDRLVEMQALHARLAASEADRAARLRGIRTIEAKLLESERDREARLEIIKALEQRVIAAEKPPPGIRGLMRRIQLRLASDGAPAPAAKQNPASTQADAPETLAFHSMSTDRALWRCVRRGLSIGTVIDVGASNGMWSAVCERHLPESRYLLVEAQGVHRPALEKYCAARKNAEFMLAAAGDRHGEIWFDDGDPFGGLASETQLPSMKRKVPVTTLDHEVSTRTLPGPYLIKLDVHGFEVPILEGAVRTLSESGLVIIECYMFQIADRSLLFNQMVAWMRERGFGVVDASEPLWRARDLCLWQMDLFFAPLTRPEFAANTWA